MAAPSVPGPVRALLMASLGLNLLVGGFELGQAWSHPPPPHERPGGGPPGPGPGPGGPDGRPPPRPVDLTLGPFARALSEEDRQAVLSGLQDNDALRPFGPREREAAFADLIAALSVDPPSREALAEALAAQSGRVAQAQAAVQAALLDRIVAMTPAERAAFLERLSAELAQP